MVTNDRCLALGGEQGGWGLRVALALKLAPVTDDWDWNYVKDDKDGDL